MAIVTDLLPITYQKLNDDCDVQARVPKTTWALPVEQRLQHGAEVGRRVLEVGVEDRRVRARGMLEPRANRGTLAPVLRVQDELDFGRQRRLQRATRGCRRSSRRR